MRAATARKASPSSSPSGIELPPGSKPWSDELVGVVDLPATAQILDAMAAAPPKVIVFDRLVELIHRTV